MIEIERIGRKKRRHVYVSREFDGAAEELLPEYVNFSTWAENQLWSALVEEHGEEAVLAAVEQAQSDMNDDDLLPEKQREQYQLTA